MTDTKLLREALESRGLIYKYIAEELGITPYGLQKKIENESDFKAKEILALTRILGLSRKERDRIFFAC